MSFSFDVSQSCYLASAQEKVANIWQSYKQERGCLMHFARLANTLLKDEESARDNHVLVCNFAKCSPILIFFHSQTQH